MSHDPRTKKCRGCGRAIGGGAYCYNCRKKRRATGMYRGRSAYRASKRSGRHYASYAGVTCSSGSATPAPTGIVANPISAPAREEEAR